MLCKAILDAAISQLGPDYEEFGAKFQKKENSKFNSNLTLHYVHGTNTDLMLA